MSQKIEKTSQRSSSLSHSDEREPRNLPGTAYVASSTTDMHAILVDENQSLVWSKVPAPVPKADEILIDIHATALNRADLIATGWELSATTGLAGMDGA